jgi:N-methylhydantoinase B
VDPPWGLHGGKPAATNDAIIRRADGTEQHVLKGTEVEINAGDVVTFLTAGGGGFGDPHERPREAVTRDIAEGVVSREAATRDYSFEGVIP